MEKEILEKAVSILVLCAYADRCHFMSGGYFLALTPNGLPQFKADPFADTLEGRKQLEEIWKWLFKNHNGILMANLQFQDLMQLAEREYVCGIIKKCLKQLTKDGE